MGTPATATPATPALATNATPRKANPTNKLIRDMPIISTNDCLNYLIQFATRP